MVFMSIAVLALLTLASLAASASGTDGATPLMSDQDVSRTMSDATARAHMQRALCHLRESCIALDGGHARSVDQLVSEQAAFERLMAAAFKASAQHAESLAPAASKRVTNSIHP